MREVATNSTKDSPEECQRGNTISKYDSHKGIVILFFKKNYM